MKERVSTPSGQESIKLLAGDFLLHEGDESSEMYYVQSGTLAVLKRKGDTLNQIGTIISGELVGEMSFLDKSPRCASVKAMSDTTVLIIPNDALDATLHALPKWFTALLHTLLGRLRKANSRIRI